jgi:hypothetical protein
LIPGFPQVGAMELLIVLAARSLGRGKREFHRGVEEEGGEAEAGKLEPEAASFESEGTGRSEHLSPNSRPRLQERFPRSASPSAQR